MVICFLSYNNRKVSGYVKSVYYDNRPFYFEGLDHLLLLMEDIMDTTDYPQVTVDYHNLKGKTFKRQSDIFKAHDDRKMVSLFEDEEIKDAGPKKKDCLCSGHFQKKQQHTGELSINAKVKVFFRSGIELMQLLYELMEGLAKGNIGTGGIIKQRRDSRTVSKESLKKQCQCPFGDVFVSFPCRKKYIVL